MAGEASAAYAVPQPDTVGAGSGSVSEVSSSKISGTHLENFFKVSQAIMPTTATRMEFSSGSGSVRIKACPCCTA